MPIPWIHVESDAPNTDPKVLPALFVTSRYRFLYFSGILSKH